MKVSICVCTACHLKGSKAIVDELQKLVAQKGLDDKVELKASFCKGDCDDGVYVTVDGKGFSIKPEGIAGFFEKEIAARVK